jgi:hypothetical protein
MNVLLRCFFAFFNADVLFAAISLRLLFAAIPLRLLFVNANLLLAIFFAAETVTCD